MELPSMPSPLWRGFEGRFRDALPAWAAAAGAEDPATELAALLGPEAPPFARLLLLRALRPDRLVPAVQVSVGIF
jgi:hypothetical protein